MFCFVASLLFFFFGNYICNCEELKAAHGHGFEWETATFKSGLKRLF